MRQIYWNEYDNGSEAENEPYTISVDPDAESTFPGARAVAYVTSRVREPMERVKAWLGPATSPDKRRSLLKDGSYFTRQSNTIEIDVDGDNFVSSSDSLGGYRTHYATFPSTSDQVLSQYRERPLFRGAIGSFVAALLFLLVASILVFVGRRRLRIEIDAGVIAGIIASLFSATVGFGCILYRKERLGWLYRISVGVIYVVVCVLNGMLLLSVADKMGVVRGSMATMDDNGRMKSEATCSQ